MKHRQDMGWLWLAGSMQLMVSLARYSLLYRSLLQKRPIILSILLNEATPYMYMICMLLFWLLQILGTPVKTCLKVMGTPVKLGVPVTFKQVFTGVLKISKKNHGSKRESPSLKRVDRASDVKIRYTYRCIYDIHTDTSMIYIQIHL